MKNLYLLFLLLVAVSACSIEDKIERREDRLIGSWQIDKAVFKDDDRLFGRNITDEFRNDRVTFFADYSLIYEAGNGEIFDGFWTINAFRDRGDNLEFTFDADFFTPRGFRAFQWLGAIDKLTGNSFNVEVFERGGVLRLKWDRI